MQRLLWLCAAFLLTPLPQGGAGVVGRLPDAAADLRVPPEAADLEERPRRIVPKSLFVAPGRMSLPCSAGYRADSRGRCVKLLWVDRTVHLQFLLDRLNTQFADSHALPSEISSDIDGVESSPLRMALDMGTESTTASDNTVVEVTK